MDPFGEELQKEAWERFYSENCRPWRGVGKLDLDITPGQRALDIGCGNGKTVLALIAAGAEAVGLDFSENAIAYCRGAFGDRAEFVNSTCTELPFPDGSFDIVTMVHILEHLDGDDLTKAVAEAERVTAAGGRILVRSFSEGDLRSGGRDSDIRGNGIAYRYRSAGEIVSLFAGCTAVRSVTSDEETRFGGTRVRAECLLVRMQQ
ncbi:MAG: methyltransferase domain-containing protein [Candidatus Methanomethylophilaceae archaeon]|nr:methyltransferase domain-containing protein [Candidatus Methanomethylophilaceae archaeon]